ncbi:HAMP domain-containing sensor histidine kinase [Fulvivirgaceae bacterium BMA10]|uniref:histidine kinase n=1 Tax=Splendidivirga corallicola TaxID=3051826 RepID=A0ABT8KNW2_9BACT|nr:HAMP domain-containing sensor histidine kinase [Fulvivirgaceae bacterium BMA10]
MTISTRLSLTSSIIASTIFVAFAVTIYLFSSNYRKKDFQERLKERVLVTEKIFLEKESFSPTELEKITNQFLQTLPEETEEVLEIQKGMIPEFQYNYPQEVRNKLVTNETLNFQDGEVQGRSRIFQVKGKNYLVIVTAMDKVGLENLSFLKNITITLALIGIPLIFIGSFIITKRALLPISKKIDKANTISASNLHQRLSVYNPNDEIGKMAIAFNKVLNRLEASFEAQKSFIRNASHEIKNPLTAIMGEAEIAGSKSRTIEEYKESLNTILLEAETLNATVNNLLQLSKVEADEENIRHETVEFDEFLHKIKESFDFFNQENQVSVRVDNGTEKGTYSIAGNKSLLKTAIINLLDNACKFSNNDVVDVALTHNQNQLLLTIKDKGIGILHEDLKKIITPFFRGNNAMKIKGSGIGLALSSKIISLHKGVLEVQSQLEIGTEVQVRLPLI